jgi:5-hydroxyisourate hydrolase-like protein (transthyretin family)
MNVKALTNQRFNFLASTLFLIIVLFSNKIYAADHNVSVTLISGATGKLVTGHSVTVYEQLDDGTEKRIRSLTSDNKGIIALINLKQNQKYFLKTYSPFDGRIKKSNFISSATSSTFVIGNKLLSVAVTNGIDNTPLANQSVTLYQRLADGSRKSLRTVTTDSQGKLSLDLPGLGSNKSYELKTQLKRGKHFVYSGVIKNTGSFAFKAGNVRVKAVDGHTNKVIPAHQIKVYKRTSNGTETWYSVAKTDSAGLLDLQLPNLITGQQYLLKAASLSNRRIWSSPLISKSGSSTFVIGNKLLNVLLVNTLNQKPLPNIEVLAYQRMPDNSLKWIQKKISDENGKIDFDLPGLGSGSKYVLSTNPYGTKLLSKDIIETGSFTIQAGALEITLRKKNSGSLIKGHKLSLYEKTLSGKLKWFTASITDQNGKVHLDPAGLGTGKVFVMIANNLFGNNKNYYSEWIISKGQFEFIVDPNDPHILDEEAPIFNRFLPSNNATLADKGFVLKMQISDNNSVKNVNVHIVDPIKGTKSGQAIQLNNEWKFSVTANMISRDQTISIRVEATDQVGNKSIANHQYSIINDIEKPTLTITSHQSGDQVDENGFFLTGTVIDNTGYVKLLATVIDPIKGIIIDHRELEIGTNHHWALLAKDLSRNQDIVVKLESTDSAANEIHSQLILSVMTENSNMIQLINRITYGATPELLKELRDYGANNFIEQQLHPELIDDSSFEQQLSHLLSKEPKAFRRLHDSQVARAIFSKRQLLEIMTQFWENHFSTDLRKVKNVSYEEQENNGFRQHALGNFRDLLQISATSPAMLKYLDSHSSHKREPNENYARELMELHTLGVDNGYTSEDIIEVARTFTGWRVNNGAFYFDNTRHDDGEKIVLNTVIPSDSGVTGGEMILDLLAQQEATAQFICTKLLQTFVSDNPPTKAITKCTTDFLDHLDKNDQIAKVLEGIFKSSAFSSSLNFHNKIKTPFEFITGLYRHLPISIHYFKTHTYLLELGMPLFHFSLPTGWPENFDHWASSNQLIQRWRITNNTIFNSNPEWNNHIVEPSKFFIDSGIETTEGVLGFLFEIVLAHDYSELEKNEALSILTNYQSEKFDIYAPDADDKIRQLMALVLQYPAYQLQ